MSFFKNLCKKVLAIIKPICYDWRKVKGQKIESIQEKY